jgi:hypothetical protein
MGCGGGGVGGRVPRGIGVPKQVAKGAGCCWGREEEGGSKDVRCAKEEG